MNKEKLISLIIRKQTYKDTKTYLTQLADNTESAAIISGDAVRDILTTDYIAEAKLYAVRYLKDAFEKGNISFINQVQSNILPILIAIAIDETDEKAVIKYAGSSYTKAQELAKFKSILSSLFRMAKECIIKWADWIPDSTRKFVDAVNQLKKKNVSFQFEFKYFRPQNQQLFKQFAQKNGLKINKANKNVAPAQQIKKSTAPQPKQVYVYDPKKTSAITEQIKHKDPLAQKTELALQKISQATSTKQLQKFENDFTQALNNYLQNAVDFKQDLVQKWFEQVENKKTECLKKIKVKNSAVSQEPKQKINVESTTPKVDQSKSKPAVPNVESKQINKYVQKKVQTKKQSKESKVQFSQLSNKKSQVSNDLSDRIENSPEPTKPIETKQPKFPQSTSKIPKGPIVFDDVQEQSVPKIPSKQKQQKSNTLNQNNAKSLDELHKEKKVKQQPKLVLKVQKIVQQKSKIQIKNVNVSKTQSNSASLKSQQKHTQAQNLKIKLQNSAEQKRTKLNDASISKDSERVDFSEDQHSEFSEDANEKPEILAFKKKVKLDSIQQENDSRFSENKQPSTPPILRIAREQQAKRGNTAASKLLQENTVLFQKVQKIVKQLQIQKQQRSVLQKQKTALQKQISLRIQNQDKYLKKIKTSVPIEDYNKLKRQLQQQKTERNNLHEQVLRLKKELELQRNEKQRWQEQCEKRRQQQERMNQQSSERQKTVINKIIQKQQKTKVNPNHSHLDVYIQSRIASENASEKIVMNSTIKKQPVDEDYIKNLTHPSNLHAWLNEVNISLFKKNVLAQSQIFYRDDYLTLLSRCNVYTQNDQQFLSIQMNFQFKAIKQVFPQVKYKNCQQLDLWTKPLSGEHPLFKQQLVVKLHRNPIKILKGQVKIVQGLVINFLLPFMYYNFLREQQFSSQQFEQIFNIKSEQLIKSKIVQLNSSLFKQPNDLQKVFKSSTISDNKIRFCLSQGIHDQVFLGQFQSLRNNKVILRMLAIPGSQVMVGKARELLQNIIFLIS